MDLSIKEVKIVESDLDVSTHSANEECKILDLTKKRVEVTKSAISLTEIPSEVNHRNLVLTEKSSEITKPEFDLQKASIDFSVPAINTSKEKIENINSQNIETKDEEWSYEADDLPELDYYPETPLDIPVPTTDIDERVNPSSKEKIVDINSQGTETKDVEMSYDVDDMPEFDYYPESPLGCPVTTLDIDKGVNPISKEIVVDRNYQDLEVKDGDGSFEVEALQELDNFQEAPLDFSMPKFHSDEISVSSKEKTVYHNSHDNEINDEKRSYEVEALPEIDITEAPINFHVPRYNIDKTVNRISKETIVDLNHQDIEVKYGLGSYWSLPELDITEAPVDFPVPRLHSDENLQPLTKEKMDSLKSEGIVIRNNFWSCEEEALLRRNYTDFLKQYHIHDGRVLFTRNFQIIHMRKMKFLKAKHFYVRLGKDINERTLRSVYIKARKMFL